MKVFGRMTNCLTVSG